MSAYTEKVASSLSSRTLVYFDSLVLKGKGCEKRKRGVGS